MLLIAESNPFFKMWKWLLLMTESTHEEVGKDRFIGFLFIFIFERERIVSLKCVLICVLVYVMTVFFDG